MLTTETDARAHGKYSMADGRYYHFLVLRESPSDWMQRFWQTIGKTQAAKDWVAAPRGCKYTIARRKFRSDRAYARGGVAEAMSAEGDGLPPYYYDVCAMQVNSESTAYGLVGFPFASLALDLGVAALGELATSSFGECCSVRVPKVVKLLQTEGNKSNLAGFETRIVTMQVSVRHDKSLAAVRLGGENPLEAEIYRSYLQERVEKGHLVPDFCVLACERMVEDGTTSHTVRSRLHVDRFGNLKFYMHRGFGNLWLIGNALQWFVEKGCLRRAETNPVLKIYDPNQLND